MQPATAIAMLHRQILANGEWALIRREGAPAVEADVMAVFVPGGWTDVVTGVAQADGLLITSPAWLDAASFPGLPRKGDRVKVQDRWRNVEDIRARTIGQTLVRVELRVKG